MEEIPHCPRSGGDCWGRGRGEIEHELKKRREEQKCIGRMWNLKRLKKGETVRIVGNEERDREVGTRAEERRCEILCIFNTSAARQSIVSEVLGTGGKSWTRKGGVRGGEGAG